MSPVKSRSRSWSRCRTSCEWRTPLNPRFRIWEALFCPNQLDLHGLAKTEEEQNSAARNYLDLWKKESGFARDAPSGDSLWRAERFCKVSGEDRLCRGGGEVCSHPIALSQRHRSGGDLHGLFDLGGERGTALCAHRTAAGRSRVARLAAQWELWHGSRGGGISEGGAGLSTRVARGAAGAGRCGFF